MTLPAIVLVDDDPAGLERLQKTLVSMGTCTIVAFADTREALAWCTRDQPSLVITRGQTEGFGSLDLIRELRRCDVDTPILILTASRDRPLRHQALALGATDYLVEPIDPIEVRARTRNMLALAGTKTDGRSVRTATLAGRQRERETILRFAKAAESHSGQTGFHVVRVAEYSRVIAQHLGLAVAYQEAIELAAHLHDVGNIGIPGQILAKRSELTPEEAALMRRHTVIGHDMLAGSTSDVLQLAATIALNHHERHDGSGYPTGSCGDSIPMAGRIVAIADVFDALTSARPYKPAWSLESSIRYILLAGGCLFDPDCVAAFESGLSDIEEANRRLRDESCKSVATPLETRVATV